MLIAPFSLEELKLVVFGMAQEKNLPGWFYFSFILKVLGYSGPRPSMGPRRIKKK